MKSCNHDGAIVISESSVNGCPWCDEVDALQKRISSLQDQLYREEIKRLAKDGTPK